MKKNGIYASITFLMLMLLFISCNKDLTDHNNFVPSIVVDGSIESNDYPRVFLTRNIPYYVSIDSSDIIYLVLRQAKVTVSDGENSETLTLMYDKDLFPPFYYQGTEMTGVAGKTYDLKVEYGSTVLMASTTIPMPVNADSVWFQLKGDEPDLGEILVKLRDPVEKNYYKIYTRILGKQKSFYPSLISNFDDQLFNGQTFTFHLQKGPESYLNLSQKDYEFSSRDTVYVKLCTLDEQSFAFWRSYQNEITNGANPFASSFHEVTSNIKGDALGIWCGFGSTIYKVIPK
jgi:hypothetical protein